MIEREQYPWTDWDHNPFFSGCDLISPMKILRALIPKHCLLFLVRSATTHQHLSSLPSEVLRLPLEATSDRQKGCLLISLSLSPLLFDMADCPGIHAQLGVGLWQLRITPDSYNGRAASVSCRPPPDFIPVRRSYCATPPSDKYAAPKTYRLRTH
ncbi:hypothetical protein BU26DRAFT_48622 [Trematosphaeria pertusa]|uniref:Uncharacterized protein n=1 Tax=Trematosphaeria pertusa TaxID=390896 RepID=A0A6A6I9E0_9PLEO|nr:uncharacterized protein BU26DRAFT_48622 [Trematosphaeria pertusa]KAF2246552.1 hypothetical protein BU26DRAFT_48622 [Trematosphaeria pertusa]